MNAVNNRIKRDKVVFRICAARKSIVYKKMPDILKRRQIEVRAISFGDMRKTNADGYEYVPVYIYHCESSREDFQRLYGSLNQFGAHLDDIGDIPVIW